MTSEPFDMETEIAAIRERMRQPLSREQIVATELWPTDEAAVSHLKTLREVAERFDRTPQGLAK